MKVFFAILLLLAVSVNCANYCRLDQEGQILFTEKHTYWFVCHNQRPYRCGSPQGAAPETRPFCLRPHLGPRETLGRCSYSEEGQTLVFFKKYYAGKCHNGIIYRCGSAPGEPAETRPFCLHHRPSSPTKFSD